MAGLYLLGLLACVVPLASLQPFRPLLIVTEHCYEPLNMTYVTEELNVANISVDVLERNGKFRVEVFRINVQLKLTKCASSSRFIPQISRPKTRQANCIFCLPLFQYVSKTLCFIFVWNILICNTSHPKVSKPRLLFFFWNIFSK